MVSGTRKKVYVYLLKWIAIVFLHLCLVFSVKPTFIGKIW